MPDWNSEKYLPLKKLTESFVNCFNNRDFILLGKHLSDTVILERGKNVKGRKEVVIYLYELFNRKDLENIQFELIDATAGFFNEAEAQIILFFEIIQNGNKKEIFVESLQLINENEEWKINRIFGISYEPDDHRKYFEPFLK